MIALKTFLSTLACAGVFGTLAASGVPTRMKPPPEPHWAQMPAPQTVQDPAPVRLVEAPPVDLAPPGQPVVRNGVTELPPGTSLATLRAARYQYVPPEYEPLGLADIRYEPPEPLPQGEPAQALAPADHAEGSTAPPALASLDAAPTADRGVD